MQISNTICETRIFNILSKNSSNQIQYFVKRIVKLISEYFVKKIRQIEFTNISSKKLSNVLCDSFLDFFAKFLPKTCLDTLYMMSDDSFSDI